MADMFDCGVHTHQCWKRGEPYTCRWLGPYNPSIGRQEIDQRLEHDKLEPGAIEAFWRGFDSVSVPAEAV